MAITEEARHRLYQRLEAVLGPEQASTLMEHLPPVGWADVATKRDLDGLAATLRGDLDVLAATLRGEMAEGFRRQTAQMTFAMLASNATLAGLAFAAARLA